jgi:hypothetical protein
MMFLDCKAVEPESPKTRKQVDFLSIATPLVERHFRITPVDPESKCGVMRNWQDHQLTTVAEVVKCANSFPHHNVGVVGKRGIGRHCFLDIDAPGVIERIEGETGQAMPKGYRVKSSPDLKPYKTHFYFTQTAYSFHKFGGWSAVNSNVKDMETLDEKGKHPTLYDLKGVGGGSFVVGAGSAKETGEVYTCVDDGPVPEIPNWLVDWLMGDIEKYWKKVDAERARKDAQKKADRAKYSVHERIQMRRKNLPEGFEVCFEDAHDYLFWRAGSLSGLGLGPSAIEVALRELLQKDVHCGTEYAETEKGRSMIRKLAHNSSLEAGNATRFYETRERRPRGLVLFSTKKTSRRNEIGKIIKGFPNRIQRSDALEKIKSSLEGFPVEKSNSFNQDVRRARKDAGYEVIESFWLRNGSKEV